MRQTLDQNSVGETEPLFVDCAFHGLSLEGTEDARLCAVIADSDKGLLGLLLDELVRVSRALQDRGHHCLDVAVRVARCQLTEHRAQG